MAHFVRFLDRISLSLSHLCTFFSTCFLSLCSAPSAAPATAPEAGHPAASAVSSGEAPASGIALLDHNKIEGNPFVSILKASEALPSSTSCSPEGSASGALPGSGSEGASPPESGLKAEGGSRPEQQEGGVIFRSPEPEWAAQDWSIPTAMFFERNYSIDEVIRRANAGEDALD